MLSRVAAAAAIWRATQHEPLQPRQPPSSQHPPSSTGPASSNSPAPGGVFICFGLLPSLHGTIGVLRQGSLCFAVWEDWCCVWPWISFDYSEYGIESSTGPRAMSGGFWCHTQLHSYSFVHIFDFQPIPVHRKLVRVGDGRRVYIRCMLVLLLAWAWVMCRVCSLKKS